MGAFKIDLHLYMDDGTVVQQSQLVQGNSCVAQELHLHVSRVMTDVSDVPEDYIYKVDLQEKTALVAAPKTEPLPRRRDAVLATRQKNKGL